MTLSVRLFVTATISVYESSNYIECESERIWIRFLMIEFCGVDVLVNRLTKKVREKRNEKRKEKRRENRREVERKE